MRARSVVIACALVAAGAHAASDCLEPLRANPGWRCHAELSNGQGVDYCLEHTHTFGADPASRFFKLVGTGPYTASCSCRAKGDLPGAAFGEDKTYLCLDRATDTVVSGKISKQRMSGQTFNVGANVRTTFGCQPNPSCDVQPVLDLDLPAQAGFVDLLPNQFILVPVTADVDVDVAYLAGCGGYASQAPNVVLNVDPGPPGELELAIPGSDQRPDSLLVVTPSGAAHCFEYNAFLPLERGSYGVWVVLPTPGTASVSVASAYRLE